MLEVAIPGFALLRLKHLVVDYNGTLAVDGALVPGVKERLSAKEVVCIGNGRNDRLMLWCAALGIAVMHREGSAMAAVSASDLVIPGIIDALDLLDNPLRLVASLRA